MKRIVSSLVLAAVLALPSAALAEQWTIDTSHSGVTFKVRHFFTKVPGKFTDFNGTISFDPAKPEAAGVNAVIQMASVDTDNEKRDNHLKSADFFDVEKHAEMTFTSTGVRKDGDKLMVDGDLTLRGVTKPVTLNVEFLGAGPDGWGGQRAGFTATTTINRKDFGVNWNKALDHGGTVLGDDVEITLDVEAVLEKAEKTEE